MRPALPAVIQPATLCLSADVRYLEFPAPAELAALVECFYVLETADPCQTSYPVVADGCADWLFDCRGTQEAIATLSLSRPFHFQLPPALCLLGLRLRPGALSRLLVADVPIRDGGLYRLRELPLRLTGLAQRRCIDPARLLRELSERLAEIALRRPPDAECAIRASLPFFEHAEAVEPAQLAGQLDLSERHFRRLFAAQMGVSPKRYQRVRRFQNSLRALAGQPRASLATLALAHGYSDQAHMTHEWLALSNLAPSLWRGRFLQDPSLPAG